MRVRYSMDASACDVETATRDGTLTRNRWTHWASPQDKSSAQQRAVERNAERLPYNINQTSNIIVDTMTISKPSQTPRFKGNFKNWIVDTETFYVTVWLMLCNLLLMLHFFYRWTDTRPLPGSVFFGTSCLCPARSLVQGRQCPEEKHTKYHIRHDRQKTYNQPYLM